MNAWEILKNLNANAVNYGQEGFVSKIMQIDNIVY